MTRRSHEEALDLNESQQMAKRALKRDDSPDVRAEVDRSWEENGALLPQSPKQRKIQADCPPAKRRRPLVEKSANTKTFVCNRAQIIPSAKLRFAPHQHPAVAIVENQTHRQEDVRKTDLATVPIITESTPPSWDASILGPNISKEEAILKENTVLKLPVHSVSPKTPLWCVNWLFDPGNWRKRYNGSWDNRVWNVEAIFTAAGWQWTALRMPKRKKSTWRSGIIFIDHAKSADLELVKQCFTKLQDSLDILVFDVQLLAEAESVKAIRDSGCYMRIL